MTCFNNSKNRLTLCEIRAVEKVHGLQWYLGQCDLGSRTLLEVQVLYEQTAICVVSDGTFFVSGTKIFLNCPA